MTAEPNTSMTTARAIEVLTNIVWVEEDLIGSQALSVLTQEIERLTDGLRFYANEDDYLWHGDQRGTIQKNDRGAHARSLLPEHKDIP